MSNLSGKAQTVLGAVEPDALGFTLMHEHLYLDLRPNHLPDAGSSADELAVWNAPLGLANLRLARRALPIQDNYLLNSERAAIDEASRFRALGGGTLVDVTSRGLGRDPAALARAARATGLNVIMGCGWYQKVFHPPEMDARGVDDLTREIVEDITIGADGTGIRAGVIGEIGVNGDPITPNEVKNIRAAARASAETGAAISFHAPQIVAEKHALLDIAEREGADLSRAIMGHSCGMAGDVPAMLDLLARGVYIEFRHARRRPRRPGAVPRSPRGDRHSPAHRRRIRRPHPAVPRRVLEIPPASLRRLRIHIYTGYFSAVSRIARRG